MRRLRARSFLVWGARPSLLCLEETRMRCENTLGFIQMVWTMQQVLHFLCCAINTRRGFGAKE